MKRSDPSPEERKHLRTLSEVLCDCGPAAETDPVEHRDDCPYQEAYGALHTAVSAERERWEAKQQGSDAADVVIGAKMRALEARVRELEAALRGKDGGGGQLMTSGEVRCPECHHPRPRQAGHVGGCSIEAALAGSEPSGGEGEGWERVRENP